MGRVAALSQRAVTELIDNNNDQVPDSQNSLSPESPDTGEWIENEETEQEYNNTELARYGPPRDLFRHIDLICSATDYVIAKNDVTSAVISIVGKGIIKGVYILNIILILYGIDSEFSPLFNCIYMYL